MLPQYVYKFTITKYFIYKVVTGINEELSRGSDIFLREARAKLCLKTFNFPLYQSLPRVQYLWKHTKSRLFLALIYLPFPQNRKFMECKKASCI